MQTRAIFVQASAIELANIAERSRKSQEIKLAWIAECSRHYEKGNLLYEGQRPVALRVCVTRSGRVAFLRRWHKNAECVNRGVRYPGRCPGLWATTGLSARPDCIRPRAVMTATGATGLCIMSAALGNTSKFYYPRLHGISARPNEFQ